MSGIDEGDVYMIRSSWTIGAIATFLVVVLTMASCRTSQANRVVDGAYLRGVTEDNLLLRLARYPKADSQTFRFELCYMNESYTDHDFCHGVFQTQSREDLVFQFSEINTMKLSAQNRRALENAKNQFNGQIFEKPPNVPLMVNSAWLGALGGLGSLMIYVGTIGKVRSVRVMAQQIQVIPISLMMMGAVGIAAGFGESEVSSAAVARAVKNIFPLKGKNVNEMMVVLSANDGVFNMQSSTSHIPLKNMSVAQLIPQLAAYINQSHTESGGDSKVKIQITCSFTQHGEPHCTSLDS